MKSYISFLKHRVPLLILKTEGLISLYQAPQDEKPLPVFGRLMLFRKYIRSILTLEAAYLSPA
jgi:hypothetical protein